MANALGYGIKGSSNSTGPNGTNMTGADIDKDFAALEHMRCARMSSGTRICEAGATEQAEAEYG